MLKDKIITLGITGSIAAYKAAELASLLTKAEAKVNVILTDSARRFITPLTFYALTRNYVYTDMFEYFPCFQIPHIDLARADLIVIAPATANVMGKIAHGISDDLLTATLLAAQCPVLICPAMNVNMYKNPATRANIAKLKEYGYFVMETGFGYLACGEKGEGRLPEPEEIYEEIVRLVTPAVDFQGVRVLITAGGTREPIDPVRFISNRSSGKMGYALAEAAVEKGARVTLISAPTALTPPSKVRTVFIETGQEMYQAVLKEFSLADIVIMAAAVADYRPVNVSENKIKKAAEEKLILELDKNPDILFKLGHQKRNNQVVVGFAAETERLVEFAREKLVSKNIDLIVANDVTQPGAGFGTDTNLVKLIYPGGEVVDLPLMKKKVLARHILDAVLSLYCQKNRS